MADQITIPRNTMIQIWICLTSTWLPLILCSKALASIGHTLAAQRKTKNRGFANVKSWDDSNLRGWDGGEDSFLEVWERWIWPGQQCTSSYVCTLTAMHRLSLQPRLQMQRIMSLSSRFAWKQCNTNLQLQNTNISTTDKRLAAAPCHPCGCCCPSWRFPPMASLLQVKLNCVRLSLPGKPTRRGSHQTCKTIWLVRWIFCRHGLYDIIWLAVKWCVFRLVSVFEVDTCSQTHLE